MRGGCDDACRSELNLRLDHVQRTIPRIVHGSCVAILLSHQQTHNVSSFQHPHQLSPQIPHPPPPPFDTHLHLNFLFDDILVDEMDGKKKRNKTDRKAKDVRMDKPTPTTTPTQDSSDNKHRARLAHRRASTLQIDVMPP